jgi:hypothetical protein
MSTAYNKMEEEGAESTNDEDGRSGLGSVKSENMTSVDISYLVWWANSFYLVKSRPNRRF